MNTKINDSFLNDEGFVNSINKLAIRILNHQDNVFLISSLTKQEGKTTVAKYLSMALSNLHYSVCMVDLDMLSQKGLNNEMTLIDHLEDGVDLEAIIKKDLDYHYLKSAKNENSVNLLSSKQFVSMINQLKQKYDFVILDGPSLTKSIDATLIAKQSDSLILVLEKGKNPKEKIKNILKQLNRNNVKISGAVFNK